MRSDLIDIVRYSISGVFLVTLAVCGLIETELAVPIIIDVYRNTWILVTAVTVIVVVLQQSMKHRLVTIGAYVAFSLALAILYIVPWTPRKPFVQDLGRIKVGMTEAQVNRIMSNYLQGTGRPARPGHNGLIYLPPLLHGIADYPPRPGHGHIETVTSPSGEFAFKDSLTFHHSKSSRFNRDWGVVTFRNGRVASVLFLPD